MYNTVSMISSYTWASCTLCLLLHVRYYEFSPRISHAIRQSLTVRSQKK